MKRIFRICLLSILSIGGKDLSAQTAKHVIIISIDGFRPDFYQDPSWPAANLQLLAEKGVYAEFVRGIFPTVTYPSHTTLITGRFPAAHGIYYNTTVGDNGEVENWIYDFSSIKSETLWEAAHNAGLKTASVSWPISVNCPYIDYNIPEIWSFENPRDRRAATSQYANPKGLFEEVVQHATGEMEMDQYNLTSLSMDENLGRIAAYLFSTYQPNLLTVHLPNLDGAEHAEGREGDEVRRAIAGADHAVSTIYDAVVKAGLLENTAIIITGDHGFVTTHTSIAANVWLKNAGLAEKCYFFSPGGSAFLHLKDPKDKKTTQQVLTMLENLPESERKLFRVVTPKEMKDMGANPNATLAITAVEGIYFNNDKEGPLMKPGLGGKHGYFPDFPHICTGFIGFGAGFNPESKISGIALEDIAPTAAALLGISLKEADGLVYPGMLEPAKK